MTADSNGWQDLPEEEREALDVAEQEQAARRDRLYRAEPCFVCGSKEPGRPLVLDALNRGWICASHRPSLQKPKQEVAS
jgi:hypothetical protein